MTNQQDESGDYTENKTFDIEQDLWMVQKKLEALIFLLRGNNCSFSMDEGTYIGLSFICEDMRDTVKRSRKGILNRHEED